MASNAIRQTDTATLSDNPRLKLVTPVGNAIRQIDTSVHGGFLPAPIPTFGDSGSLNVFVNGATAWRIGDKWTTHINVVPDPDIVHLNTGTSKQLTGSTTVLVNGIGMAYMGTLVCGGVNLTYSENVWVGP